jgi:hypothetical protein
MVKPGPVSKKKEIMFEILNLLSKKPYGFRELHRSLPREHRAGSFATLHACIKLLKSQGYIYTDPETKKLRLTSEGDLERKKQPIIKEINEAKMIAGYASSSDASPIIYEWSLAKHFADDNQNFNCLRERLKTDTRNIDLFFLFAFLSKILMKCENDGIVDKKQTLDDVRAGLWNDLRADVEIINIVAIDIRKFSTWLETPSGTLLLQYAFEQKIEGKMKDMFRLVQQCSHTTLLHSSAGKREDAESNQRTERTLENARRTSENGES